MFVNICTCLMEFFTSRNKRFRLILSQKKIINTFNYSIMKRSVLILSLAAFVLSSNAQVLKSNLLNGYKQGDKLEKATYNKADAPIKIDTWCEAFSSQTDKNAGSPITGQELSYEDIRKKSIYQNGRTRKMKGSRFSVYSISERMTIAGNFIPFIFGKLFLRRFQSLRRFHCSFPCSYWR